MGRCLALLGEAGPDFWAGRADRLPEERQVRGAPQARGKGSGGVHRRLAAKEVAGPPGAPHAAGRPSSPPAHRPSCPAAPAVPHAPAPLHARVGAAPVDGALRRLTSVSGRRPGPAHGAEALTRAGAGCGAVSAESVQRLSAAAARRADSLYAAASRRDSDVLERSRPREEKSGSRARVTSGYLGGDQHPRQDGAARRADATLPPGAGL
jgi:hypothetical protein